MLRSRVTLVSFVLGLSAWVGIGPTPVQAAPPTSTPAPTGLPGPHDRVAAAEAGRQSADPRARSSATAQAAATTAASTAAGSLVTYRVFATQYAPNTPGSVEVALPDKCAKFAALGQSANLSQFGCPPGYALGLDYRVSVSRDTGQTAAFPVKDAGPWNIDDNYWGGAPGSPRPRRLFGDLPRGMPEAQAAFSQGYNSRPNCKDLNGNATTRTAGTDQFGRCVLNPAGVDLSSAAAAQLGLGPGQNDWVNVSFLWEPGDNASKPAIDRRSRWLIRQTHSTGPADFSFVFGDPTDVPVMGDWDGNGSKTPGVFRNGAWYLRNSFTTGRADVSFGFGNPGDLPVVGDWNGDGVDTPGLFRGGLWYLRNTNSTGVHDVFLGFGDSGDKPVAGDWNGDRVDTPGLFRGGLWYLRNTNSTGVHDVFLGFGNPGDMPVVGDWNGDRVDTPGLFRGGVWYLRNSNTTGRHDVLFGFGDPGDLPVVWN